jgi:hypothetical protein
MLYARNNGGALGRERGRWGKVPSLIGPYERLLQLRLPQFGAWLNVQEAWVYSFLFRSPHEATKMCAVWVEKCTKTRHPPRHPQAALSHIPQSSPSIRPHPAFPLARLPNIFSLLP